MTEDRTGSAVRPKEVSAGSVARNTLLSYVSSVFALFNGVAISIIVARCLGPERLGIYSGLSFIVSLTISIFSLGIGATIIKILSEYGSRLDAATMVGLLRTFAFGVIAPASLSGVAAFVVLHLFNRDDRYAPLLILVSALCAIPAYLAQIYRNLANGLQEFEFLLRLNLMTGILLLCATGVVAHFSPSVTGFVLAGVLPNLLVVGLVLGRHRGDLFGGSVAAPLPRRELAEIVEYLWPMALISMLDMIVWQYSEVLFLGAFRPVREVALYTLAFSMASLLLRGVASSVTASFMPAMSQLHGLGEHDRIRLAFYTGLRLALLLTLPVTAMIAAVARPLVLLLYGTPYLEAGRYVPALVVAAGLGTIASMAADVMYSSRRQQTMLVVSSVVAVLNLSLDAMLVPAHGVPGAVIANVSAQAASALATISLVLLRFGEPLAARSYLGPMLAASIVLAATWPIADHLHGIPAILATGVVGSSVYLIAIRALHIVTAGDARVLAAIAQHVPNLMLRRTLDSVLRFCVPKIESP